ncbi:metalloprotease [Coemansia sp. RSA 1646]|nr:metalloprotease [Coemansia sp. RSA 1646]
MFQVPAPEIVKDGSALGEVTSGNESLFLQRQTTESKLPYHEYTGPMEQSPNDHRQHRLIRLPNGLTALCTHDLLAETATSSLSVNVGSIADPPSFLGMAHFLEHMLFMGSAKYPDEDDYSSFISNHSGVYNAATADDYTYYHFSIDNDALEGALDRLSWFFVHPLLNPDGVDREVNAVDSEYKSGLRDEYWRFSDILRSLSNPEHPYSKFNVGNLETLRDAALVANVSLADEVRKFYNMYYSSSIMRLSIVGNHSLDQLTEWAVSKFSAVEDRGDTRMKLKDHPVGPNELGKVIFYKSLEDSDEIILQFPVPNLESRYRQPVHRYFSVLFNTDTTGSLLSYLKEKGWATSIGAYNENMVRSQLSSFYIGANLTPLGMDHYQDVVKTIFAYLQMLKEIGPQVWFYKELSQIMELGYQFYERPDELDWAIDTSKILFNDHLSPEHVLSYGNIIDDTVDPQYIADYLQHLNPTNYRLLVGSQKHKLVECNSRTRHYNVPYHVEQLNPALTTEQIDADSAKFSFPKPNVFIPENLKMSDSDDRVADSGDNTHPQLLKLTDNLELWFRQDRQFHTPHGAINVVIEPRHLPSTPQESVLGLIYSMCLSSVLKKELYGAAMGGMGYSVDTGGLSVNIGLGGFKEKLSLLLSKIMHQIANFELKREDYELYRQDLEKRFSQLHYFTALQNINMHQTLLMHSPAYNYKAEEYALHNNVTFEKTQEYIDGLFKQTFVQMMVSGQFTEADALDIGDIVVQTINSPHLSKEQMHTVHSVSMSPGSYVYSLTIPDEDAGNSGVISTIYCGKGSDLDESAALMVIRPILHNQFFEEIRTKEQLGYIVGARLSVSKAGRSSFEFIVQGEQNPIYTKLRIDAFIRGFREKLVGLSDNDIQDKINVLAKLILEKHKSIAEQADEDWDAIDGGWYDFNAKHKLVERLRMVKKEDVLGAWDKHINPETASESYTRIDYHAWSQKAWIPQSKDLAGYSEGVVALFGCLQREGVVNGTLDEVEEAVHSLASGTDIVGNSQNSVYGKIDALFRKANSALKSKVALDMAVDQLKKDIELTGLKYKSTKDYSDIGMQRTPDGTWIIGDMDMFKSAQGLNPSPEPVETFVPKYSN